MKNSKIYSFLREPLLHFLLIGSALFLFYNQQNGDLVENNRIIINEAYIERLISIWEKKKQRLPTNNELQALIEQQIRNEVMYREAIAMGLDKNDSIVRRRMVQKVEFISADLAALAEPTDAELVDYLAKHHKQFELPARLDFVQVYINPNKHDTNSQDYANNLLNKLTQSDVNIDNPTLGDSIMLDQLYKQVTEHDISRLLGKDFAKQLFTLPAGGWQGPVSSGYGYHLVRIENRISARLPALETIREKLKNEWLAEQRRVMNDAFYNSLRQRYEIVVKKPTKKEAIISVEQ